MDKRIAEALIEAQTASDAGKGIYILGSVCKNINLYYAEQGEYAQKDEYIRQAIALCRRYGNKEIYYHVQMDETIRQRANGDPAFVIYFNFKLNGKRKQISFHSFGSWCYKYLNSPKTTWDKGDCRKTCVELYNACFIAE